MNIPSHCRIAANHAERLVRQFGITALPVDPFAIANQHEIIVRPKPGASPGISGFLMKVDDTFGIMYATHVENEGFIRFTVAHELGHYFLPGHHEKLFANGQVTHESQSGFISRDRVEEEADHFAAALLMPSSLFSAALNDAGEGFAAIEHLASLCKTSITATAIRFATHSPDPVAIIVSNGSKTEYCFMSEVIRDLRGVSWIRKGELVPRGTATCTFNKDKRKVAAGGKAEGWTTLDLWFDGAPEIDMKEDVVGLGSYGKTLTVLFADQPIDAEDDDRGDDDD